MGERNKYEHGTFCWVDLGTTHAADAKRFYQALFGWALEDRPIGGDQFYTMFTVGGKHVAALYEQSGEQRAQGVPPAWLSYVSVKDVDETAAAAKQLGGTVLMEPFDVFDSGRMALVQDPTGAVVGLWQPKRHIGAGLVNQPGTLCWNELATRDRVAAGTFYTRLFDWNADTREGPVTYTTFRRGDRRGAGMLEMNEQMEGIPPHWMPYFAVADCDAAAARAGELGAQTLHGPADIPEVGRFAVIRDPQGAVFSIIHLLKPDD